MRRHREAEPENHERWVVSYADFITLLFAFFVVMYSISSVNEGKYKVLSETLETVFRESKNTYGPLKLGLDEAKGVYKPNSPIDYPVPGNYPSMEDYTSSIDGPSEEGSGGPLPAEEEQPRQVDQLQWVTEKLEQSFADLIDAELVEVSSNDLWVELEIKSSILFPSGQAQPHERALPVLLELADILKQLPNPIHVEGFTDNVPISTSAFPSNWELSAARAAAVVRMLVRGGADPVNLAAVGYGEHQPIADNSTEQGRQKNRRVVLVISRDLSVRRSLEGMGSDEAEGQQETLQKLHQEQTVSEPEQSESSQATESQTAVEENRSRLRPIRTEQGGLLFTADPPAGEAAEEVE